MQSSARCRWVEYWGHTSHVVTLAGLVAAQGPCATTWGPSRAAAIACSPGGLCKGIPPPYTLLSSFWYCGIFFSIWDRSLMVVCNGRRHCHSQGLRNLEKGGDDSAKDFCARESPLQGFGDTSCSIARSVGQGGVCSSTHQNIEGRNPTQDLPPGSLGTWLRLRWCFQLLAIFTPNFHQGTLTNTSSGGLRMGMGWGQRLLGGDRPHGGGKHTCHLAS